MNEQTITGQCTRRMPTTQTHIQAKKNNNFPVTMAETFNRFADFGL